MNSPWIWVTGGAGFIGSHMALRLRNSGKKVLVLDSFERGRCRLEGVEYLEIKLEELTRKHTWILETYPPNQVFHFAGFINVAESVQQPDLYRLKIFEATKTLLGFLKDTPASFIFSSTAAVYGLGDGKPLSENDETKPINPYGKWKLKSENLVRKHPAGSLILRYFNAAGASSTGEIGEEHDPETHLIPNILLNIRDKKTLEIFGTDYDTKDGTCIRDYVHVEDLVYAHEKLSDQIRLGQCQIYNLGSGSGFSIREVIGEAQNVTGKKVTFNEHPRRPGDPASLTANNEKIRSALPGFPQKNLTAMIQDAWSFFQKSKRDRS